MTVQTRPFPSPKRFLQHWLAYAEAFTLHITEQAQISRDVEGYSIPGDGTPPYTLEQCRECPYDDDCCRLAVSVTPFEGLGILFYVQNNLDAPTRTRLFTALADRAEEMLVVLADMSGDTEAAVHAWALKGRQCVFCDNHARGGRGGCSIYAARPIACRKAFSVKSCRPAAKEGPATVIEHGAFFARRCKLVQIPGVDNPAGTFEMTSLLTNMLRPFHSQVSDVEREFLLCDPEIYTQDQILWGPAGKPQMTVVEAAFSQLGVQQPAQPEEN